MAPVAKKKNSNKRTVDNKTDGRKDFKNNIADKPNNILNTSFQEQKLECNLAEHQDKRYSKRGVSSNWKKYEEASIDPHADTMRGKDFEVLLSYSGGFGSQLQLQDEKDWEETVEEKTIALDIKDLVHVVKTIPFHKQLNLPTYIFTESQLAKFNSSAETCKNSYSPSYSLRTVSEEEKKVKKDISGIPESLDSSLNIIDNSLYEEVEESIPTKPVVLEEKTESIIESLASCLSLKTSFPEKKSILKEEVKEETQDFADDLDFLLSLNVTLKNPMQEEKQKEDKKTNVDDWLKNLLDD